MKKKVTREIELNSLDWFTSLPAEIYFTIRGESPENLKLPLEYAQMMAKIAEYVLSKCE